MVSTIQKRYQIQTLSAKIHREFGGPLERQCNCLRSQNGHASYVDLFKKPGQKYAYFKGLQTCGSPWSCPICRTKISEHRQKEIEELLKKTENYHHYLVTLTIPHYIEETCYDVKHNFLSTRRKFKNRNPLKSEPDFIPYRQVMQHYHYDGSVTTVEVTNGRNGWHVHSHELFIFKEPVEDLEEFRQIIYENWKKSVHYSPIQVKNPEAFYKRSVQVDHLKGDHLERMRSYLLKVESSKYWGMSAEMTKGQLKKAENGNLTPFGMLHKINDTKDPYKRKRLYNRYAPLFYEYCKTFKGSQMTHFSKGLKRKYGIESLKDKEVVDAETLMESFYGNFEIPEWQEIKALRMRGFIIQRSDREWSELYNLVQNEIILRRALRNGKKTTEDKTFFRDTG